MKKNLKILVATDYSKPATNAVRYAVQLAKETESSMIFLHVYESSLEYPKELIELEGMDEGPVEFEMTRLEQYVEDEIQALKIKTGEIKYKCYIRKGKAGREICDEAIESDVDFIVVGTHGVSGLTRVFLGSHTWDIVKKATFPVLAIPIEARFDGVKTFVFATEYRKSEIPAIKFLTRWARYFTGELMGLHVTNDVFSPDFERGMLTTFQEEVKSSIPYDKIDIKLSHNEKLIDGLNEFCIKTKSSWLVMSPEKSLLFERVFNPVASRTKKMIFYTHVPLFTVPDCNSPENAEFWKKAKENYGSEENEALEKNQLSI